ncbi:MAG: imidazolonepropionase [Pirellulaceae bacterium]
MTQANAFKVFSDFRIATCSGEQGYELLEHHVIGVRSGVIEWIRDRAELGELDPETEIIHGHGRLLTPGLIDCHTHLVYGGNRAGEWESRLNGASYEEIARAGGGILSSVRSTRAASEDELYAQSSRRLVELAREGITTVEIKSGYGLDLDSELKMLRVARRLEERFGIRIERTLLAAHAVPPEYVGRSDDYIDWVCREAIPTAVAEGLCSAVDAFCETIAFSRQQTERVLQAGIDAGLKIKVHAEQLSNQGMAASAARMGAMSVDHLEYLSADDCKVLAENNTVAVLLPGAFYCLRETQLPPITALREANAKIAVATDANPGSSPMLSLLLAGNMACNLFQLTPQEVLLGMTINAAQALGLANELGSIAPGKLADFAVWDVEKPAELFYTMGHNPCVMRFRGGERIDELVD